MKKVWVGDAIKKVFADKENRSVSATKIAKRLGIARSSLYNIVNDEHMEPVYAVRLAKLLNINLSSVSKELEDYQDLDFNEPASMYETKSDSLKEDISILKTRLIDLFEENRSLKKEIDELRKAASTPNINAIS